MHDIVDFLQHHTSILQNLCLARNLRKFSTERFATLFGQAAATLLLLLPQATLLLLLLQLLRLLQLLLLLLVPAPGTSSKAACLWARHTPL